MKNIIYKNWKPYIPEENEDNKHQLQAGGMFLQSDDSLDWYKFSKELNKTHSDKFFVVIETNGNVRMVGTDAEALFPCEAHVVVVTEVPEDMIKEPRNYKYTKNNFVYDSSFKEELLRSYIEGEIQWSGSQIGALEDISLFGKPTKEEEARLLALRKYRFTLTRIKPEDDPDVDLPTRP